VAGYAALREVTLETPSVSAHWVHSRPRVADTATAGTPTWLFYALPRLATGRRHEEDHSAELSSVHHLRSVDVSPGPPLDIRTCIDRSFSSPRRLLALCWSYAQRATHAELRLDIRELCKYSIE